MCGRFALTTTPNILAKLFQLDQVPEYKPRYNIAPTQPVVAVLQAPEGDGFLARVLKWGLVPSWAQDPQMGSRLINARAETIAEKPAFRQAFRHRRCLLPADGFYEWVTSSDQTKQPYLFRLLQGDCFSFAGLWEHWESSNGTVINSCTILTTDSNELIQPLHHRMPVIVPPESYKKWLDLRLDYPALAESIFRPYPAAEMTGFPVDPAVNDPHHDTPACMEPTGEILKPEKGLFEQ